MVWSALAAGVDPWSEEGKALWLTEKTARVLEDTTECLPWKVRGFADTAVIYRRLR